MPSSYNRYCISVLIDRYKNTFYLWNKLQNSVFLAHLQEATELSCFQVKETINRSELLNYCIMYLMSHL